MIGDALGSAAGRGHREDIDVAVVFAGEGERVSVGGELGFGFEPDACGETLRFAALAADRP